MEKHNLNCQRIFTTIAQIQLILAAFHDKRRRDKVCIDDD